MLKMPGKSYTGPLPPLTSAQISLRDELRRDVETLAGQIGQRNIWNHQNLTATADFLETSLAEAGAEKEVLEANLASGEARDREEIMRLPARHQELTAAIARREDRWARWAEAIEEQESSS